MKFCYAKQNSLAGCTLWNVVFIESQHVAILPLLFSSFRAAQPQNVLMIRGSRLSNVEGDALHEVVIHGAI